jgi:DNA polymerase (family 10)
MQDPKHVAQILEKIAILMSLSKQNGFKAEAYRRGAMVVAALGDRLASLIAEERLREVEGIGASLCKQILEIWSTGESTLATKLEAEYPPGAAELALLPGMTLRRMRTLHEQLGIKSLDELREACASQRVRGLPGFGPKTEDKLRESLARAAEPASSGPKRLLLVDAIVLAKHLELELCEAGAAESVQLAGAARRGEESIDELDLVVVSSEPDAVWETLGRLTAVVALDPVAASAQLAAGVWLRVHLSEPEQAGAQLLAATGPAAHLAALRARAREHELELTDAALLRRGKPARAGASEAAIYHALELAYVPPELRVDGREVAEAAQHGWDDLLEPSDVLGMVHCHTTFSDGKDSVDAMARAAEALGMKYITITDHSPSAHYARGVELDRLKRQWDEIAEVQERVNIRILRGTESDILADGSLDYPDEILEQLDVVIASIHSRLKMDPEAMTERLVRAMRLPLFKIWGHALGRLLHQRDPIQCDVPRVLDALAESNGAVEINSDPNRLDLAPEWIPHARERGIPFVVSVDAHSTRGLGVFPFGVTMARRGRLKRSDVLNTLGADAFAARVRPM